MAGWPYHRNWQQLKHLLRKINLAQQYHADKLFEIIQTPTDEMIEDSLTKPKSTYNYATVETTRVGVYKMPNYQAQEGVLVLTSMIW